MEPAAGVAAPDEGPGGLHPAFRILLLVALAAMLFRYSLAGIALVLAGLMLWATAVGSETLQGILKSLRRIRWLLLSIVIIYLWVAPEPGIAGRPWYLPAWSDIEIALQRAGVLVVLVTAVELLRRRTSVPAMAAGLLVLLAPLTRLGLDTGVFARRLAMTLDAVPLTAERVAAAAGEKRVGRGLAGWGDAAATLVRELETGAIEAPSAARLPRLPRPGVSDWAWLAAGLAACWLVGRL